MRHLLLLEVVRLVTIELADKASGTTRRDRGSGKEQRVSGNWIFVLFLIYTSAKELSARLGHGELIKIFFRRSSELAPPHR